jgi:8-oxo-dGTP pyrophosphatase MutT (NUDIX family)
MNYCSECGKASIEFKIPEGDTRPRHVCAQCEHIFYQNPRCVCGTLPIFNDQILLCKRAIEPRYGFWTLPAGFMENGESSFDAAIRETYEEAQANVTITSLYSLIDLPDINQIHFFFAAQMTKPEFSSGTESLEVELFREQDIPWGDLAFKSVEQTLQWYFEDRHQSQLPLRTATLRKSSWQTGSAPIV